MLSLEQCRKIDPRLRDLPDKEVLELRDACYSFAEFAFEMFLKEKADSNNPLGPLSESGKRGNV